MNFPPDFLRGAATCATEVEGPECAHRQHWADDVDWLVRLGHNAYGFSLARSTELDFYDRLVDYLCARKVRPVVTLCHSEQLGDLDSWSQFARACGQRLGDRVSHWITVSDPAAPLRAAGGDWRAALGRAHQLMLAHHRALQELRPGARGQLGLSLRMDPGVAAEASPKERRRAVNFLQRWFLQAAIDGSYPSELAGSVRRALGWEGTLEDPQPLDFLGILWRGSEATLSEQLLRLHRRYPGLPLLLSEHARPERTGVEACLRSLQEALRQGVPVRGYLHWSLLGRAPYPLLQVHGETGERSPTELALWLGEIFQDQRPL